jgi:hypothetical protein
VTRLEGLGNKIIGAVLHRLDSEIDGAIGRNHDDGDVGISMMNFFEHIETLHTR